MTVTIDVGTTAVKVLQFNDAHYVIDEQSQTYPTMYTDHGQAEQDPDTIIELFLVVYKNSS